MIVTAHHVVNPHLVSAAESGAIGLPLLRGQVRAAVLLAVFNIGTAMILKIFASALEAILKALTPQRVEFVRREIPGANGRAHLHGRPTHWPVHDVRHRDVVAPAESLPISPAQFARHTGVSVFIAIIHVRAPVVIEVPVCAFDAIVKAAALNIVPSVRRPLPVVAVLAKALRLKAGGCRMYAGRREQYESSTSDQCRDLKLSEIHRAELLFG
jgi:hypothetical protein